MKATFCRIVVDERGIRERPFLLLFGPRLSLTWSAVTGWAVAEGEVRLPQVAAMTVRVLELHTAGGMQSVQRVGTDADFGCRVEAVRYRFPGRQIASVLARARPDKFR
jgi:hypothetical protein